MKENAKTAKKLLEELLSHPAIMFADTAIGLQAARTSTGGYTGLSFEKALETALKKTAKAVMVKKKKEFSDYDVGHNIACERQQELFNKFFKE